MAFGEAVKVLSRVEVADAIRSLTPASLIRLRKVAAYYSLGRPLDPNDLLQEAFLRALDTRQCPAHVDVVRFLAEAIRSIAYDTSQRVENKVILVPVAKTGGDGSEALNVPDPEPSAENRMIEVEDEKAFRDALFKLFEDDPVARDIVEGDLEGMVAEELRELTGLDKTSYASKRKLIRRRIDKAIARGWKP